MPAQVSLLPVDVPVALWLLEHPGSIYQRMAEDLGISTATGHASVQRLQAAGIVRADRGVNRRAMLEFLVHGVRYAFPAQVGAPARGVATAYASPALADVIVADEAIVWPDPGGNTVGLTLTPLLRKATSLPARAPAVYELLTLVDAVRAGRARERALAVERLEERIMAPVAAHAA